MTVRILLNYVLIFLVLSNLDLSGSLVIGHICLMLVFLVSWFHSMILLIKSIGHQWRF